MSAVRDLIRDTIAATTKNDEQDLADEIMEAFEANGYVVASRTQYETLVAERDMANEAISAARDACKQATGGNAAFIDDDCALSIHTLIKERDAIRAALAALIPCVVNPGDGGPYEAGELPELDAAIRALIQPAGERGEK